MRIAHVKLTLLDLPNVEPPAFQAGYDRRREILVVEVETAGGITGLGYQLYLGPGFKTTRACLEEIMIPHLIGRNASEVEAIWRALWRATLADGRGGAQLLALSAVDVALWDVVGQFAGLPVHRPWSNYRSEVPVYGPGCWHGSSGDGRVEKAARFVADDYGAIKMQVGDTWTDKQDLDNVRRIRDAVGGDIDIMVDARVRD